MCDSCTTLFDDEVLRETTTLRQYLVKEEKKITKYIDKIIKWIDAERAANWKNHDCNSSKLQVLGAAKAKKLGISRKSKSRVRRATQQEKSRFPRATPPEFYCSDSRTGILVSKKSVDSELSTIQDAETDNQEKIDIPTSDQQF
jgi:hypothetical protein